MEMDSDSSPATVTEPPAEKKRPKVGLIAVALGSLLIVGGGLAVVRKEANGLRNALSLSYWRERTNKRDLYSAENRFLKRGNREFKSVSFTFDDGPHPKSCARLLDILKQTNTKATFFVVGKMVKEHPELVKRMIDEGHEVANHTQDHIRLDSLSAKKVGDQIDFCEKNVYRATGRKMTLFRPPGMRFNQMVLDEIKKRGYITVGWTVGAKDFAGNPGGELTPQIITERVIRNVENGAIILLHDNPVTIDAMPEILKELKEKGYKTELIGEMLGNLPSPVKIVSNSS